VPSNILELRCINLSGSPPSHTLGSEDVGSAGSGASDSVPASLSRQWQGSTVCCYQRYLLALSMRDGYRGVLNVVMANIIVSLARLIVNKSRAVAKRTIPDGRSHGPCLINCYDNIACLILLSQTSKCPRPVRLFIPSHFLIC
jgi:hypothetical protein